MGSFRGRLTCLNGPVFVARIAAFGGVTSGLVLLASPARAEVCVKQRPEWDGMPVGVIEEAVLLALSPAALVLLAASMIVIRYKSQWGALVVVLLWTGLLSLLTMLDPTGMRPAAQAEGCIGSPALFIGLIIALCAGMVVYTAPRLGKSD